jgi:HEAT repeat protein
VAGSLWGSTPRESIAAACARRGVTEVVAACVTLIRGGDVAPDLVAELAGPGQERFLDAPPDQRYWLRVWGVRGLLWALTAPGAPPATGRVVTAAVGVALGDRHWRVREMAAKLVARHGLDAARPALTVMLADGTPRVRVAAARALRLLESN